MSPSSFLSNINLDSLTGDLCCPMCSKTVQVKLKIGAMDDVRWSVPNGWFIKEFDVSISHVWVICETCGEHSEQ